MAELDLKKTVFRLRQLPETVETPADVAELLSKRLRVTEGEITVRSLAQSLEHWENPRTKVATVMFKVCPSPVLERPDAKEWYIDGMSHDLNDRLILDTHFLGLTPLNDHGHLQARYDCVVISGLASHPFGSWQPKEDKKYMWILDKLARGEQLVRAILYGYDTKLQGSTSFQTIPDLAKQLIDQLHAHRDPKCETPLAFLAHSLGGLVLKQALLDLAKYRRGDEYRRLLNAVRGAIFFGVPSQGMETSTWEAFVQEQPNEILIKALSKTSDFIPKLTKEFNEALGEHCKFFWAYEQNQSPTVIQQKKADGQLTREGKAVTLVTAESATCGFINSDPDATIPITDSHSGMVKFRQNSPHYAPVREKLWQILLPTLPPQDDTGCDAQSDASISATDSLPQPPRRSMIGGQDLVHPNYINRRRHITELLKEFKSVSRITENEAHGFASTTWGVLGQEIDDIQSKLNNMPGRMNYLHKLDIFTEAMRQFGRLTEEIELFSHDSNSMAYIWGPMKYILASTYEYPKPFKSILEAYESIGDQTPQLDDLQNLIVQSPHLREVLVNIYEDVVLFQAQIIRHLRLRQWDQLFVSWFKEESIEFRELSSRIDRNKQLIENNASQQDLEAVRMQNLGKKSVLESARYTTAKIHSDTVRHWLSAFDIQTAHEIHIERRKVCEDPGRWLLQSLEFERWARPETSWNPLLWLRGLPGAGKSVLASIVIDNLLEMKMKDAAVAYFYCKQGDDKRTSVEGVTRSILAQLLDQNPDLLPYFHENAQTNVSLASSQASKQILGTSLRSFGRVYLVLDGLDECGRDARKAIASRFREMVDLEVKVGSIRCLFISQVDGAAEADFQGIPFITIGHQNTRDIKNYVGKWQQTLVAKFGASKRLSDLQEIISKAAKGLFIFAELFAKFLEQQLTIEDLEKHLFSDNLPVEMDSLYDRILGRVLAGRDPTTTRTIEEILGWIVCARRPLRWEEIQTAYCTNPESRNFEDGRRLTESPLELFASLVVCHPDTTVDLVHGTARQYLTKKRMLINGVGKEPVIKFHEAHFSLAMRCLTYLSFPEFYLDRKEDDIKSDLLKGFHQLYDYASACWAMHLEGAILHLGKHDLTQLYKALRRLVESHWSKSHKPIQITGNVRKALSPFGKVVDTKAKQHGRLLQAVAWAKKQSGPSGEGPSDEDALTLWKVTAKIRAVLEGIDTTGADFERIQPDYRVRRYKCPRVNCYYYHHGFRDFDQRERHTKKHTRPYLCAVAGCPKGAFGYAVEAALRKHLRNVHHITDDGAEAEPVFPILDKEKASNSGGGNAKFHCPECDATFPRKWVLKRHKERHNVDRQIFACAKCPRIFPRKDAYERHQQTHSKTKKYFCGSCPRIFSRRDSLKRHQDNSGCGKQWKPSKRR
ncbi:hypothetical protein AbraIFM66951_008668 [Aspergillus brasiliensis]|uniref:C2H2-type domain-containing protein n=1 Tax=Aspergillus brasiliensis TaxID=319629 RepID=A0A9W5YRD8_9EURO|nr:hypothetical protein AbraCBS73388_006804 [Aspergillus brasiliensis]GKZ41270.1 hypothetical protein AbraIFM66951_008668 [Aspergillus brasiliensis]